jgi:hypothetical protein
MKSAGTGETTERKMCSEVWPKAFSFIARAFILRLKWLFFPLPCFARERYQLPYVFLLAKLIGCYIEALTLGSKTNPKYF